MSELLLSAGEQQVVRALIAAEDATGPGLPGRAGLEVLVRLIPCDASGIALLEVGGDAVRVREVHRSGPVRLLPDPVAPRLGVHLRPLLDGRGAETGRARSVLSLGVGTGSGHVVTLWLVRCTTSFSERDRALLELVAPALERAMRAPSWSSSVPALTVQERRVMSEVAAGLSNAQIAQRLCVAPGTVRKHLENAYRKLGVTNRVAAVRAVGSAAS